MTLGRFDGTVLMHIRNPLFLQLLGISEDTNYQYLIYESREFCYCPGLLMKHCFCSILRDLCTGSVTFSAKPHGSRVVNVRSAWNVPGELSMTDTCDV
jgi:hypothetical protein